MASRSKTRGTNRAYDTSPAKTFVRELQRIAPEKSPYERFTDFVELAFCAIAKRTAPNQERANVLEDRYMHIVASYRDREAIHVYAELLAIAAQALHVGGCDFLGSVAGELDVLNRRGGQFFTPYAVGRMMAEITLVDIEAILDQNGGFFTMAEPASGAGGLVLASADVIDEKGFAPATHMLVYAVDISVLSFHMTYVQLALRGVPAYVAQGNSLSLEMFDGAWTPAAAIFRARHGRLFDPAAQHRQLHAHIAAAQQMAFDLVGEAAS